MSFETVISWVIGWIIGTVIMRVYYAFRNNQRIHPIPDHYTLPDEHSTYLQQHVTTQGVYYVLGCTNEEGKEYLSVKSANLEELRAIKNKMQ